MKLYARMNIKFQAHPIDRTFCSWVIDVDSTLVVMGLGAIINTFLIVIRIHGFDKDLKIVRRCHTFFISKLKSVGSILLELDTVLSRNSFIYFIIWRKIITYKSPTTLEWWV